MKTCKRCKEDKPYSEFYSSKMCKDGYLGQCKKCVKARDNTEECKQKRRAYAYKKYHSRTEEQRRAKTQERRDWFARTINERKNYNYTRLYGLSLTDVQKMRDDQGQVCAICKGVPLRGRPLAVDHCHVTGRVRGLLCYKCNRNMALLDNPSLMNETINYANRSRNE